LESNPKQVVLT